MDNLDVDIDSLRRGAEELERAKEGVRGTFEAFQAALESYAGAFGGDDIGMLLGTAHQACIEAAAECFSTNLVELEDYVDSLHAMADKYQAVEDEAASSFSQLLGSLGG
ncbi:MAG TPA: type VII secretion target [Micromonosporaceae bacterium]|nr:type VII secretion target [Micromonosporaceae bacterium]